MKWCFCHFLSLVFSPSKDYGKMYRKRDWVHCQQASTPMYTRMNGCCACLSQLAVESFNRSGGNCLCFLQDMTSEIVSQYRYTTYCIQHCYHSDIYKRITETGSWCTVPWNLQSFPSFQPAISLLTFCPLVVVQWKSKEWPEWLILAIYKKTNTYKQLSDSVEKFCLAVLLQIHIFVFDFRQCVKSITFFGRNPPSLLSERLFLQNQNWRRDMNHRDRRIDQKASARWWLQMFFYYPDPWGKDPFWRSYFSNESKPKPATRVVQPISSDLLCHVHSLGTTIFPETCIVRHCRILQYAPLGIHPTGTYIYHQNQPKWG